MLSYYNIFHPYIYDTSKVRVCCYDQISDFYFYHNLLHLFNVYMLEKSTKFSLLYFLQLKYTLNF
jgi:hypothetical protein